MIYKLFSAITLTHLITQCGIDEPKLKKIPTDKIKTHTPAESFHLTADQSDTLSGTFEGALLIWAKEPGADNVAFIQKKSLDNKKLQQRMNFLKAQIDSIKEKEETYRKKPTKKAEPKKKATQNFFAVQSKTLLKSSGKWFEKKVTDGDKQKFAAYCDAALYRFLATDFYLKNRFTERPHPAAICSSYYEEKGYFTDPSCAPSKDPAGQSYYACFMGKTGIFKSSLVWTKSGKKITDAELEIIQKELQNEENGRQKISSASGRWGFLSLSIGNIIIQTSKLPLKSALVPPSYFLSAGADITPDIIGKNFEDGPGYSYTFNDLLHNLHLVRPAYQPQQSTYEENLKEGLQSTPEIFGSFPKEDTGVSFEEVQDIVDSSLDKTEMEQKLFHLEEKREPLEKEYDQLFVSLSQNKISLAKNMIENKSTDALWPSFSLKFTRAEDKLQTAIQFDISKNPHQICFHINEKKQVPCNEEKETPAQIRFIGKDHLEIKITAAHYETFGFIETTLRDSKVFQIIPQTELTESSMILDLYVDNLENLRTLGGTVKIMHEEEVIRQGSVSLLADIK